MIEYIKARFKEISTWKGVLAVVAAIVMYFTPDEIDRVVMLVLTTLGVTDILKVEKQ